MVRTWRRELGLAKEKHRTTTSDLGGEKREKTGLNANFQYHNRYMAGNKDG